MKDQPTTDDMKKTNYMRDELRKVILERFREQMPAHTIAAALMILAREQVYSHPKQVRNALIEGFVAFMKNEDVEAQHAASELGLSPGLLRRFADKIKKGN